MKEGDKRFMRHGGTARTMHVVEVAVELIDVGERRRQDYGDIAALAAGIRRVGLIEPIVVDETSDRIRLIAGERRLRAVQFLGWKTVPARLYHDLSHDEIRDIELEENENRKALTERERARTFKSSKTLVENAKTAAEEIVSKGPLEIGPGRKSKYGAPKEEIASSLAVSHDSITRAEQHVETAEKFPFMQGESWRQSSVLAVRERLEEIPAAERDKAADVLACAQILHPEDAVKIVGNLAAMDSSERSEIYGLSQSTDPRDRTLALTKAAKLPPMPDPRLHSIDAALESLRRASKPFPSDPITPRIQAVMDELKTIRVAVKAVSYDARRDSKEGVIQ